MSRSKRTKYAGESSTEERARIKMERTRRAEVRACERALKTGDPEHRRRYFALSDVAQKAQDEYRMITNPRDTGWEQLRTQHGVRFHREIGKGVVLDIEQQFPGTTWIASYMLYGVLRGIEKGCSTAQIAAVAIEAKADVSNSNLGDTQ
jgi:hypothetical protein